MSSRYHLNSKKISRSNLNLVTQRVFKHVGKELTKFTSDSEQNTTKPFKIKNPKNIQMLNNGIIIDILIYYHMFHTEDPFSLIIKFNSSSIQIQTMAAASEID